MRKGKKNCTITRYPETESTLLISRFMFEICAMLDEERKQDLQNYTIESNYVSRVNPHPCSLLTPAENAQSVCTHVHDSISGYTQLRGDQINYAANRVSLSFLPGALHCAGDSVGGDLRTWWGEAWNNVQAAFLTLILGRMHHRGACRVLVHAYHLTIRLWWVHRVVCVAPLVELCSRSDQQALQLH